MYETIFLGFASHSSGKMECNFFLLFIYPHKYVVKLSMYRFACDNPSSFFFEWIKRMKNVVDITLEQHSTQMHFIHPLASASL